MGAFSWVASAIGSGLVALVITLVFHDPLKRGVFSLLSKLSLRSEEGIEGLWIATFHFPNGEGWSTYEEAIHIEQHLGIVTGRIVPNPVNHRQVKQVEKNRPVRLRGQLKDNNYVTGIWLHPSRRAHFHGSFQLIVYPSGNEMTGQWLGFSERKNEVVSGAWEWRRTEET